MKLIILGPQGSGKGTQAKLISKEYNIPHISTGEILRENIKQGTDLGKKAKEIIDRGDLVPDELVIDLVKDRLSNEESFILDGFPRNINQAKSLDVDIDHVIYLDVPDEVSIERISGRRECRDCGEIYSIHNMPEKCEKCGGELYQRDDDNEDAVKRRLEIFHNETNAITDFYNKKGIIRKVNGTGNVEDIFNEIKKILGDSA